MDTPRTLLALAGIFLLSACSSSHRSADIPAAPGLPRDAEQSLPGTAPALGTLLRADGTSEGALGTYWLVRDPTDPLSAHLEFARSAQAQGDQYELSIRPFLLPTSLQVLGSVAGPDNTTDYTIRFTHPIAMPANLNPPSTATQRADLFVFDVNLVLTVEGGNLFFANAVKTNLNALANASGFRQLGPLVTTTSIGIANGTNTFPYRLVTKANHGNPRGNYDAATGWIGNEYLTPTGYDVVPQGATVDTMLRITNTITAPLPILVVAKYMDPRAGTTTVQKRANRLPSADPKLFRYFLPQTAGDLQRIEALTAGTLTDNSSAEVATITSTILDWDNAATVASTFPNHSSLNQIAESSRPVQLEASIPQLKASGTFTGTIGASSGLINEFVTGTISVTNVDKSFTVTTPGGETVRGLLRVRDQQDTTNPKEFVLNEALVPQTLPVGFEPTTRYQVVTVQVVSGTAAPQLTAVAPLSGIIGAPATFSATNIGGTPTTWSWNFGGGALPNTSTLASPIVTLAAVGSYSATVTATNPSGNSQFDFTLVINDGKPVITAVSPPSGFALRPGSFSATISNSPTSWSWNFGGGAVPNVSSAAAPNVTFALAGNYSGTLTATNSYGSSVPFPFNYTVNNKIQRLRIRPFTSGGVFPPLLQGLPSWSAAGFSTWITNVLNPIYLPTGVQFSTTDIEFTPVENPALFNIDTNAEATDLILNHVRAQASDRLNVIVINSIPFNPSIGGEMQDSGCNFDNVGRGCWIKPYATAFDNVVMAHELGHVQNLMHIRVVGPINAANFNLMSYGTNDTSLSASIVTETGSSCRTFPSVAGDTVNQLAITNDWEWTWGP